MQCEKARASLQANAYAGAHSPGDAEVMAHLDACADCRAFRARSGRLDDLLDADEGAVPRPGFDTRFFARLAELKTGQRARASGVMGWLRWVIAAVPVAAAAAMLLLAPGPGAAPGLEGDLPLAMELELLEEMEILRSLDELEAYEVLAQLDIAEMEQVLHQPGGRAPQ